MGHTRAPSQFLEEASAKLVRNKLTSLHLVTNEAMSGSVTNQAMSGSVTNRQVTGSVNNEGMRCSVTNEGRNGSVINEGMSGSVTKSLCPSPALITVT
ncbi:hypothetical protein E2C01_045406 [Portunus trituberculatus]|uniref:Uncharacterized protein n=1 Tax=Portunus trituberculatus TaxID=210409 RepID=A0A5B7G153_PORTR|nr:hypothetical protein [Portunus trituberculatus]